MGRLRPLDMELVQDPMTGVEVLIQRDRQRTDYCCEIGTTILRAQHPSDLIRKTADALRFGLGLEWQRSIVLFTGSPDVGAGWRLRSSWREAPSGLRYDRVETAQRADGLMLCRDWPPLVELEISPELDGRQVLPLVGGEAVIWPYTDARWKDLEAIAGVLLLVHQAVLAADLSGVRTLFRV